MTAPSPASPASVLFQPPAAAAPPAPGFDAALRDAARAGADDAAPRPDDTASDDARPAAADDAGLLAQWLAYAPAVAPVVAPAAESMPADVDADARLAGGALPATDPRATGDALLDPDADTVLAGDTRPSDGAVDARRPPVLAPDGATARAPRAAPDAGPRASARDDVNVPAAAVVRAIAQAQVQATQQAAAAPAADPVAPAAVDAADAAGAFALPPQAPTLRAEGSPPVVPGAAAPLHHHPTLQARLDDALRWMSAQGLQQAQVRVDPEHLGPITIQIALERDVATVVFGSNQEATRQTLEAALPGLRDALAAGGMSLGQASVGGEQRQTAEHGAAPAAARAAAGDDAADASPGAPAANAPPVARAPRQDGRIDLYA